MHYTTVRISLALPLRAAEFTGLTAILQRLKSSLIEVYKLLGANCRSASSKRRYYLRWLDLPIDPIVFD
jgi:hypothetical protein